MDQNKPLNENVKDLKLIARDALRKNLISPILASISSLKASIVKRQEDVKEYKKDILRSNYRASKIEDANPDADDLRKEEVDCVKGSEEQIKNAEEGVKSLEKDIESAEGEIKDIESGKTKVSAEDLEAYVAKLVLEAAKVEVRK